MKSSNNQSGRDDLVEIGKVAGVHGIHGAVKIYAYTESPACFAARNVIILVGADGLRRTLRIVTASSHKAVVRLTLDGVTTRNQAQALSGCGVFISRASLPAPEQDSHYWIDLIGLEVHTTDGEHLGRITQIIPTGANDVYVVRPLDSRRAAKEILIPAIKSVVLDIDLDNRYVRVALPEGLLDL